jgi:hypothetical protein
LKTVDVFKQVLLKEKVDKKLNLYFNVDIFLQGFPEENPEQKNEDTLSEDIFKFNSKGQVPVPYEDVENIQTIDDLVDYVSDIRIGGKPIINDLVEEIILAMAGVGEKAIEEIVNEGDKIVVNVDYGSSKEDSIGFKVNKIAGSSSVSLVMKKDNKIIPGNFDINEFNKQLIFYRNSLVE